MQFDSRGPPHPGPLPKERERSSTVFGIHWTVTLPATAKWFSLSLRERAGVRGKGVSNWWIGLELFSGHDVTRLKIERKRLERHQPIVIEEFLARSEERRVGKEC